jgi:hypothetical protein
LLVFFALRFVTRVQMPIAPTRAAMLLDPLDHASCEPRVNRSKQFVSKAHVAMVSWQQRQAWAPDDPDDDNLA